MKKFLTLCFLFMVVNCTPVIAKDLFVSTAGNDSILYDNNNIGTPWLTIEHSLFNALAGDTVYFRTGSYAVATQIDMETLGSNGTIGNPIIYKPYNDESVTWSSGLSDVAIYVDSDYIHFQDFVVTTPDRFFYVGWDITATGVEFDGCDMTLTVEGGATNKAPLTLGIRAIDTVVENCRFYALPTFTNDNTAGIFIWRTEYLLIKNNEFYNIPTGIFYKHTGGNGTIGINTGSVIKNNYFTHETNAVMEAISTVGQYVSIQNNLCNNSSILVHSDTGGSGNSGTNHGGDNNTLSNNTIVNGSVYGTDSSFGAVYKLAGDNSGSKDNIFSNNITVNSKASDRFEIWLYGTGLGGNTADYNLYPDNNNIVSNGAAYTLSAWQIYSGLDANSLSGAPIFTGGASPTTIAGFALDAASVGYQAGDDGNDMGADVSLVGVNSGTIPTVVLQSDKTVSSSPTTYTGTATATTGRTISGVVSSGGFTVTPDDGGWDELSEAFTVSGVTLTAGANTDTCTATDSAAETGSDSITITLTTVIVDSTLMSLTGSTTLSTTGSTTMQ